MGLEMYEEENLGTSKGGDTTDLNREKRDFMRDVICQGLQIEHVCNKTLECTRFYQANFQQVY